VRPTLTRVDDLLRNRDQALMVFLVKRSDELPAVHDYLVKYIEELVRRR
jgi:hypothetical protein